jgi:hypothetical protein
VRGTAGVGGGAPSKAWLTAAGAASVAVIVSAPFAGQLRAWLRAAFPESFATLVGAAVALAVAGAALAAFARIRHHRLLRWLALIAAMAAAIVQGWLFSTGQPEVDSVERVHFVEYGLVTLLFYRAWRPIGDLSIVVMPVLAGLIVGTLEEWLQWFIPNRVGEARDVLLNLGAIGSGLLFSLGLEPPASFSGRLRPRSASRIGAASAAVVLVYAAFVHVVHLGYEVRLEDVATFRSRYAADRLALLSRDRAARWQVDPPVVLKRFSAEDQYMDEGLWHVRRRNDAWMEGDYRTAVRENLVLEAFFAPVLDTPSYVSAVGHRWPADQRADAVRRTAGDTGPYVSDAEPYPLMTWPRARLWTIASAAAGLLAAAGVLLERRKGAPPLFVAHPEGPARRGATDRS